MTTAPGLEVQSLIYSTLKADTAVMALVSGVYDKVPTDPWGTKLAYISFGPTDINVEDADCIVAEDHTIQLDVWSRSPGYPECKKICAAVKDALHEQSLTLTDNALAEINLTFYQVMRDPDGLTSHGVLQFRVAVEVP